jgi:hypothetical protein
MSAAVAICPEPEILNQHPLSYTQLYERNNSSVVPDEQLIEAIVIVLNAVLKQTDRLPVQISTVFHSKGVPSISLKTYLLRISKCSKCSPECLLFALIYIDRIVESNQKFTITSLNIHR